MTWEGTYCDHWFRIESFSFSANFTWNSLGWLCIRNTIGAGFVAEMLEI